MNTDTKTCSSCYSTCTACNGSTATDCTKCSHPFYLDGTRCLPCCNSDINQINSDMNQMGHDLGDCCHCVSSEGPCSLITGINRQRSISKDSTPLFSSIRDQNNRVVRTFIQSPLSIIAVICICVVLLFGVVFTSLQLISKSRPKNFHEYRKVSSDGYPSRFDMNVEKLCLTAEDLDEEDSLFEKT